MGHTRLAFGRSGSSIRPAAPVWADAGSSERTSQSHDTTRVSHSKSHAHRHRSRPGSSPNRGQSHSHSTSHYSARQQRTGWTTHPTRPARTASVKTPWTIRCCLVNRCPPAPTRVRASDLPATAPHTASQHPISLSSIRPATCGSVERSEVPRCPPNGPTIDGKDGVAGSIPAGGSHPG